jgi:hypothetical protein
MRKIKISSYHRKTLAADLKADLMIQVKIKIEKTSIHPVWYHGTKSTKLLFFLF